MAANSIIRIGLGLNSSIREFILMGLKSRPFSVDRTHHQLQSIDKEIAIEPNREENETTVGLQPARYVLRVQ